MRENEFREQISEEELTDFSSRIQKLSDKKIDELWYLCGFIILNREKKFKAIRQIDIDSIRENLDSAKEVVWDLIEETPIKEFKKNLFKIKK